MLTYVSLFSCAGVGCYGFKQEGFECIATNELVTNRLNIQRFNNKCKYPSGYIGGSITEQSVKEALMQEIAMWKEKEGMDDVTVVIATPPCQGMSGLNIHTRQKGKDETPRNSLVVEAIQMVKTIKPKFFIFENVQAFPKTPCLDVDGLTKPINEAINYSLLDDYEIYLENINFVNYGSNSSRPRCLTVGMRRDLMTGIFFNDDMKQFLPRKQKPKTTRECIGHLPSIETATFCSEDLFHYSSSKNPKYLSIIADIPEGYGLYTHPDVSKRPEKAATFQDKYTRRWWDTPSVCIHTHMYDPTSQATLHPRDNRTLTLRESMILQTIPNEFKWMSVEPTEELVKKNANLIYFCVGESVPTAIFRQMAQHIKNYLT